MGTETGWGGLTAGVAGGPGECWTSALVILVPARTLHSLRHMAGVEGVPPVGRRP